MKEWSEAQPSVEQAALWLYSRATNYPKKRALELLADAIRLDRLHSQRITTTDSPPDFLLPQS